MAKIGKLKEIDVRNLWKHEQRDFSAWLAKENNLEYLNDILGLTLTDINTEEYVGPFRCDIVAKDETTNDIIIIENQLEPTNHDHLGKTITYAAGLNAKYIVWIAKKAKEEHRAAIEWLNNNSSQNINFFLIEIHAYQIGNSEPAPLFKIIEQPNDFIKSDKNNSKNGEINKTQSERLVFWDQFNQAVAEHNKPFNIRKATTDHWYDVALGTSDAHIAITLVNKENKVGVELYISDDKKLFDKLYANREAIEAEFGAKLEWERLDERKASRIKYYIDGLNFDDHSNYSELNEKIISTVTKMRKVFKKYLKTT
ncbi:DUF4268 domain-containing protein [Candidatus Saccharibacteria bacterium]|nr:DUF4268 domain-containing protein [Candidatus Saccharibacteria bacterium]